jgi:hypothetical protein
VAASECLVGCALWDPFDYDQYVARADGKVSVDGQEYSVSWDIPITRESSFNPYSHSGRQDVWRFQWGGANIVLKDGRNLYVDLQNTMARKGCAQLDLLGITGMWRDPEPGTDPDALSVSHPLIIDTNVDFDSILSESCDKHDDQGACEALVKITVPKDYIAPNQRDHLNGLEGGPSYADCHSFKIDQTFPRAVR